jgi:hypothetical protein
MRRHGEPSVISVGTEHDPQKFLAGAPTYGISERCKVAGRSLNQ